MHLEMPSQSNLGHLFPETSTLLKAKKNKSMSQCSFALSVLCFYFYCYHKQACYVGLVNPCMEHAGLVNSCLKPASGAGQGGDTATEPQWVDEGMEERAGSSKRSGTWSN